MIRSFYCQKAGLCIFIKRTLFLLTMVTFSGTGLPVLAQSSVLLDDAEFRADARAAIDSLYNRKEAAARQILEPWTRSHPDNPVWKLWEAMELWWDVLEDLNDDSMDGEFFEMMQRADYEAGKFLRGNRDHPDGLIVRSVANGYVARHHANREEWVTSVNIGRRAYQAHQRLIEVYPELPDNYFAEGMKLYYSAYIPDTYTVVRAVSWLLPDGDRNKGLEYLGKASDEGVFAGPEAGYFLGVILLNYENQPDDASEHFRRLSERYPDNGFYRRLYLRTLAQMRQYTQVIALSNATLSHWDEKELGDDAVLREEVYHWLGRAQFYTGRMEESLDSFSASLAMGQILPNRKKREFQTLSAYYAGRASERLNRRDDARSFYRIAVAQESAPDIMGQAKSRLSNL